MRLVGSRQTQRQVLTIADRYPIVVVETDNGAVPRLKVCPKCKSRYSLFIDRDHFGWYEECLQCGYQHDMERMDKASEEERAIAATGKPRRARRPFW